MKLNADLENIHFYIKEILDSDSGDDERYDTYKLIIINDYKSLAYKDLNEHNIKEKPAKFFYSFKNLKLEKYSYNEFKKVLNDFVGSSTDYKNPLFFDINNHIKDNKVLMLNYLKKTKYIKFSECFFSYYLKDNQESDCDTTLLLYIFENFLFLISIIVFFSFIDAQFYIGILLILLGAIIINLIVYYLYKCCKYCNGNILRIDFIKTKDLNIFIGVVKYTETKYVNTFEFQKDNINKFIYEGEGNNSTTFNLKVLFKNEESQQICTLEKQTQNELEALICYLNGEFMNTTNPGPNSYEQI